MMESKLILGNFTEGSWVSFIKIKFNSLRLREKHWKKKLELLLIKWVQNCIKILIKWKKLCLTLNSIKNNKVYLNRKNLVKWKKVHHTKNWKIKKYLIVPNIKKIQILVLNNSLKIQKKTKIQLTASKQSQIII